LPLVFEITEGQRHDSKPAKELVLAAGCCCLLADTIGCALLWLRI
jgi:hypothetical protein